MKPPYGSWDEWRERVKDNLGANVRIDGKSCVGSEWMNIHLCESGRKANTIIPSLHHIVEAEVEGR